MSDISSNDSHEQKPKAKSYDKLTMIIAASALLLTLVNTVLIVMNPTAKKVEQFNEELKIDLAETVASFHKKVDGLRLVEVEWQMVLKKAKERPDAIYKVVNTQDGYLTLVEIEQTK
jgi:galactose-1-phosphate uridylyltransferase